MASANGALIATPGDTPTAQHAPPTSPFPGLAKELSDLLDIHHILVQGQQPRYVLVARDSSLAYLPGQPRVPLATSTSTPPGATPSQSDLDNLLSYLRKCHLTDEADDVLPFMKYIFVQTPSHRHVAPLHHQEAHGRKIIVSEHPGLHLLWYYDRIFVKPIPAYFYSGAFWHYVAQADPEVHRAAVGFMRSYYHLLQYQIDFDYACKMKLIPKKPDGNHPSWDEFCRFIGPFRDVSDDQVCRRYHYGELRLSRLNKTVMLFRGRLAYFHIHPQWGSYLSHILGPIITIFVVISVVLNSMQVTLQAVAGPDGVESHWEPFVVVAAYFPVAVICLVTAVLATALSGILVMGVKDLIWAKTVRHKKKRGDPNAGEKSHGMVW